MSQQVLHFDFIKLAPDATPEQARALEAVAAQLSAIDGVIGVGVIDADGGSDFDIAFWFLLREFTALEPFGTDTRYSAFLQKSVAPVLKAFAGADVKLEDDFEPVEGPAACLALIAPEEAYDFEVREALEAWAARTEAPQAAIGLAVGERQLYRGAALAFGARPSDAPANAQAFRVTLIHGQARSLA